MLQPQSPVPLRPQVFHPSALTTPEDVARQLNTMQAELHSSTLPARTNSRNQAITFEGVNFNSLSLSGTKSKLTHNLGTKVRWSVVRWYNTSDPANIREASGSQDDANTLVLTGGIGIGGTADVEVWSAS